MSMFPSLATDLALESYLRLPAEIDRDTLQLEQLMRGSGPIGACCQQNDFLEFLMEWQALRSDASNTRPWIEGSLSCTLYDLLKAAPRAAIEDVGYWRWLAADPLQQLVLWQGTKHPGEIPSKAAFGILATSHASLVNSLPYRMYLRGAIATIAAQLEPSLDRFQLATTGGNSLWATEILRRKGLSSYPLSAVAFLNEAHGKPVPLYRAAVTHLERLGAQFSRLHMSYREAVDLTVKAFEIAQEELDKERTKSQ